MTARGTNNNKQKHKMPSSKAATIQSPAVIRMVEREKKQNNVRETIGSVLGKICFGSKLFVVALRVLLYIHI